MRSCSGPIFPWLHRHQGLSNRLASCSMSAPRKLLGIHDRHRPRIISRNVVTYPDRGELDARPSLDPPDHLPQVALQIGSAIGRSGRSSTGAPSLMISKILLSSGRPSSHVAQSSASPSIFSLSNPSPHHRPKALAGVTIWFVGTLVDDVPQVHSSRPGYGHPSDSHASRLWPPFQPRVVKPRISV